MLLEIVLLLSVVIILGAHFRLQRKRNKSCNGLKQIPVVPGGLPVLGHLFDIKPNPFQYLNDLRDSYGPIYSIQLGWEKVIVMNNYDVMIKTFKEQGNNFSGRWQTIFTTDLALDSGILFTEKEWWATQRSFTLRVLREFGFGKRSTEDIVHRETEKLIKMIQSKRGEGINTNELISLATVNIISDFIMKREFKETDEDVVALIVAMKRLGQAADINSLVMNLFPAVRWFPKFSIWLIDVFHPLKIIEVVNSVTDYIAAIIEDHRKLFNPANECHDLIDAFLLEQHKLQSSGQESHSFTDWQLVRLISELLLAGFETTATTFSWTLLLLAKYSDVQKRLRDEISDVIGFDRFPTMSDKRSFNYGLAVLDEIYRFSTVLPLSIAHRAINDAVVDGYFIPAGSVIFPNIYGCHRDPDVWEKPFDFYPDHFLDQSGTYKSRPELMPFGVGKRQCLGEQLARMEEFLVLVRFLQKFEISLTEEFMAMDTVQILGSTHGTFRATLQHKLYFREISERN